MSSTPGLTSPRREPLAAWAVRQPLGWCSVALLLAGLGAVTAPASDDPVRRVAFSLLLGGAAIGLAAIVGGLARLLVAGVAAVVAGTILIVDADAYLRPVRLSIGVVVVLLGLALFVALRRRGFGVLVAAMTGVVIAANGALFVLYDRPLLPIALGVPAALAGLAGAAAVVAAHGDREEIVDLAQIVRVIAAHAGVRGTDEPSVDVERLVLAGPEPARALIRFAVLMAFSSTLAALGVIVDSTAVVIGAMLVAPLLSPLMGLSLTLVLGWPRRVRRAVLVVLTGSVIPVVAGVLTTAMLGPGVDTTTNSQIVSRASPNLIDLAIAVAAGAAGAYATSRRDVADSLPGVAIAVALVPPLAVAGIAAQAGDWSTAGGALTLFLTNAIAIVAVGGAVFVLTGAAAALRTERDSVGHWVVGLATLGAAVLWLLVDNSASAGEAGFRRTFVEDRVEEWIGDREYDITGVDVDGSLVTVEIEGAEMPDDVDDLASGLVGVVGDDVELDLRLAVVERQTAGG